MITTVTTHQSQLHGRILLTEVTQYIINLAAQQHVPSEQYGMLIIHTIRYNVAQMSIFINKFNRFTTNIKLRLLHTRLQRYAACDKETC